MVTSASVCAARCVMAIRFAYALGQRSQIPPALQSHAVATLRSHYGVNTLLAASFGAAMAWGIVVGTLNVLADLFKRTKRNKIVNQLHATADQQGAIAILEEEFDVEVLELVPAESGGPSIAPSSKE
jgi:hypothetical protein